MGFAYIVSVHTATGHRGSDPLLTALWLATVGCAIAMPIAWMLRSRARGRAALRRCPACRSTGVRAATSEQLDLFDSWVHVQCGQCGVWRRLRTRHEWLHGHSRALARDQRRMSGDARRLARRRAVAELRGFVAVLRAEIVSADDFLARTTPPRPLPRSR